MSAPTPRMLEWAPIGAHLDALGLSDEWAGRALGRETRVAARRHTQRAKHAGLTVWEADILANAIGLHPALVWGDAWWSARAEPDGLDRCLWRLRCWLRHQERACRRETCRRVERICELDRAQSRIDLIAGYRERHVLEEAAA